MNYKKSWVRSIKSDLKGISEDEFDKLDKEFDALLDYPFKKIKQLQNCPHNMRRLRIGEKRLIFYISDKVKTVFALAYLNRGTIYSNDKMKALRKIIKTLE